MSHISLFENQARQEEVEASRAKRRKSAAAAQPAPAALATPSVLGRGGNHAPNGMLWGSVLATPRRGPRLPIASRRISFQPDLRTALEDEGKEEDLKILCGPNWTVHRLSPLFGLDSSSPDFLRRWASTLEQDFLASRSRLPSELASEDSLHVTASLQLGLRGTVDDDEALLLEMRARPRGRVLYTAVFVSVDNPDKLSLRQSHDADLDYSHYPVLLSSGLSELHALLASSLSKCFDCVVTPVRTEEELRWVAAIWVGLRRGEEDEEDALRAGKVKLTYQVPALENEEERKQSSSILRKRTTMKELQTVALSFNQMQLCNLWKSIHDPKEGHATREEIDVFHDSFADHIRRTTQLHVENLPLKKVELPVVTADAKGKLQIHSPKHAKTILRFVTELCSLGLSNPTPCIGVTEALI